MPDHSQYGRGTEDMLASLHGLMTDHFKDVLKAAKASGEPIPPATLNAIRQFLKDNGIDCIGRHNPDINDITKDLPVFEADGDSDMDSPSSGLLN